MGSQDSDSNPARTATNSKKCVACSATFVLVHSAQRYCDPCMERRRAPLGLASPAMPADSVLGLGSDHVSFPGS